MTLNLIIMQDDIISAEMLIENERINLFNSDSLFRGAVYTMLSAQEKYTNQIVMYAKLLKQGLDNPDAILHNRKAVAEIIRREKKYLSLINLSKWWQDTYIANDILDDIKNGRKQEFEIRNRIAEHKKATGLNYKGASLFLNLCLYLNVVAIDSWTLRALVAEDYPIKAYKAPEESVKNFKHVYIGKGLYRDRGVTVRKEYELYEQFFRELTGNYNSLHNFNFTPFEFRQILWVKRSTWGKEFGNDSKRYEIEFI